MTPTSDADNPHAIKESTICCTIIPSVLLFNCAPTRLSCAGTIAVSRNITV
jgi:hypothetical protein